MQRIRIDVELNSEIWNKAAQANTNTVSKTTQRKGRTSLLECKSRKSKDLPFMSVNGWEILGGPRFAFLKWTPPFHLSGHRFGVGVGLSYLSYNFLMRLAAKILSFNLVLNKSQSNNINYCRLKLPCSPELFFSSCVGSSLRKMLGLRWAGYESHLPTLGSPHMFLQQMWSVWRQILPCPHSSSAML